MKVEFLDSTWFHTIQRCLSFLVVNHPVCRWLIWMNDLICNLGYPILTHPHHTSESLVWGLGIQHTGVQHGRWVLDKTKCCETIPKYVSPVPVGVIYNPLTYWGEPSTTSFSHLVYLAIPPTSDVSTTNHRSLTLLPDAREIAWPLAGPDSRSRSTGEEVLRRALDELSQVGCHMIYGVQGWIHRVCEMQCTFVIMCIYVHMISQDICICIIYICISCQETWNIFLFHILEGLRPAFVWIFWGGNCNLRQRIRTTGVCRLWIHVKWNEGRAKVDVFPEIHIYRNCAKKKRWKCAPLNAKYRSWSIVDYFANT